MHADPLGSRVMWTDLRPQVLDDFDECSSPAGCLQVRPKPLAVVRSVQTKRGKAYFFEIIGTNVRRIAKRPGQRPEPLRIA